MIKRTFKRGMVIALTAALMTTSVSGVFTGTAATVFAKESARKMAASVGTKAESEIPKADILDLAFDGGKVQDRLNGKCELKTYGEPAIEQDEHLGREVATFDGKDDGFGYLLTPEDWKTLDSHYSFECMVKESKEDVEGRYGNGIMGSEINRDGSAIAFKAGGPTFLGLKSGRYTRDLTYQCDKEKWVHIVGTYDGKKLILYINGQKQKEFSATEFTTAQRAKNEYFNIAAAEGGATAFSACKIASARVYSRVLGNTEIKSLYEQEEKTDITVPDDANFVAVRGDTYTVPEAVAQTATGNAAEIIVTVKDPKGNDVILDENREFAAMEQGKYQILYTANKTTIEKTLRVMGEPTIVEQTKLAAGDQEPMTILNLDKEAKVQYITANPEIAVIDDQGMIQAKKSGETAVEITVDQAGHCYPLSGKIIVTEKPSVTGEKEMMEGETYQLAAEHTEPDAKISYISTTPEVAAVSGTGEILARKAGTAEIKTSVRQNKRVYTLNTKVTVQANREKPEVPATPITPEIPDVPEMPKAPAAPGKTAKPIINVKRKKILANHGFKLRVGNRTAGSKLSFRTGNKKIVTVTRAGYVKGLRAGKAMIVTTLRQGGKVFTFKTMVNVKGYIKFKKVKKTIRRRKSYTFKAKAYGTEKKLKWSVSNKKLGKISKKGKFEAKKKKGKVYVIVKSGKYTKRFLVKIK